MTEDEMVGWHHRINGHEFGDGQGSRARIAVAGQGAAQAGRAPRLPWGTVVRFRASGGHRTRYQVHTRLLGSFLRRKKPELHTF